MSIEGIDRIVYGVEDIAACRKFFSDWGLKLKRESAGAVDFESLNGCEIQLRPKDDATLPPPIEPGPTLRELTWGVDSKTDLERLRRALAGSPGFKDGGDTLACTDPNGLGLRFRMTQKRKIDT